ncbi:MAG: homoserine O-acetyltransferase/O-succinyltransferase family protein, partial [Gemmatimonadaceae bacterium]
EYDPGALFREYRRDVARFLAKTVEQYPALPRGYFDDETARVLDVFRSRAVHDRRAELIDEFPAIESKRFAHNWRATAARIYSNWLSYLASHRGSVDGPSPSRDAAVARAR